MQKILELCESILYQSEYFDNFIGKFSFFTMKYYKTKSDEKYFQEDLNKNIKFSSNTFYILDSEGSPKYIRYLLENKIYPIPMFMHEWQNHGIVGNDKMYNTLCDENLYLSYKTYDNNFLTYCFLFDGNRVVYEKLEEVPKDKYNNQYDVYDEFFPHFEFLEKLGYEKVTLLVDKKRVDIITTCQELYEDKLEIIEIN